MLIEAYAYIVYIRESYYFSVMCTFKKAIKNSKVKGRCTKGALRLSGKIDN